MVGADETMELRWPPRVLILKCKIEKMKGDFISRVGKFYSRKTFPRKDLLRQGQDLGFGKNCFLFIF